MHDRIDELVFLPGAGGNTRLWQPVAERLSHPAPRRFVAWPGLGGAPPEPGVRGLADLVERVVRGLRAPAALLAQSMGGVVAVQAALERPELVKRLVLSVTSGGVDVAGLGGADWRADFARQNPSMPRWFLDDRTDLTSRLRELSVPVLLLWGDADTISPVAVGKHLHALLPRAELVVLSGGTHDLVCERADEVAPLIDRYLG